MKNRQINKLNFVRSQEIENKFIVVGDYLMHHRQG